MLSHPAAERVGLARVTGATVRGIGDNAKLTGGYRAIAERFQIGDVAYRDAVISVADQSFVGIEDGLIGANVLGEFLITLDFAGGKLRLDPLPGYHPGEEFGDRTVSPQMENCDARVSVRAFAAGAGTGGQCGVIGCLCWIPERRTR